MLRIILFVSISAIIAYWLQPLTEVILHIKGDFVAWMSASLPIGWLGFTAIFTAMGLMILYSVLQFFK